MSRPLLSYVDDDVLIHIIQTLHATGTGLKSFSMTCRRLRRLAMPVLFRSCHGISSNLPRYDTATAFIPAPLWSYIRELNLRHSFGDGLFHQGPYSTVPTEYRLKFSLEDMLREMPNLHTIVTAGDFPWMVLRQVLSVSRLRTFRVHGPLLSRREAAQDYRELPSCSLEAWEHIRHDRYRLHPRMLPAEIRFCEILVSRIHSTAKTFTMPTEIAPLMVMSTLHWPELQELQLVGAPDVEAGVDSNLPLIDVLAHMPRLRRLVLKQAHYDGTAHRPIWPGTSTRSASWPELETLILAHPHPDDIFFEHLPGGLKHLSLECWPRHYLFFHTPDTSRMDQLGWTSPILASSEILRVLSRSALPEITRLELELIEDDKDEDLFHFIPRAFPQLEYLKVHRYRRAGNRVVPVQNLASAVAPLQYLRTLWLYLDFATTPHPWAMFNAMWDDEYAQYMASLNDAASTFARTLGPSLEFICMLRRNQCRNVWLPYRIVREDGVVREVVPLYGAEQVGEYSTEDERAPPYRHTYRHEGFDYKTGRN
ncbi:hypothetical protein BD414DRAFT_490681 [Trametes punicea]|nr:hypothetical protein BD414DRAFT_490681 [Trametes punicea]